MNYILFDDESRSNLLPFTFTRPVADIRIGILTIREKWEKYFGIKTSSLTENYLSVKFPVLISDDNVLINGSICPDLSLVDAINKLEKNQALINNNLLLAVRLDKNNVANFSFSSFEKYCCVSVTSAFMRIAQVWEIFSKNGEAIKDDYILLTKGRKSAPISNTNKVFSKETIFIEDGARVECSIINAEGSYIYIGKDAEIMEGSIINGSFALCEHATIKMGAKIYGPTTIGPYSKVGGEVNNAVIFGYSSKAHDGFLGNSVLGEWCNIGADSNNSNLKNNYAPVKVWNYKEKKFLNTGLQFCGLMMGDHSKCGINTMFNTGTVVAVSANIYGAGFPRTFIPSFTWGSPLGFTNYELDKAIEVAERVCKRRDIVFGDVDAAIFKHLFEITATYRELAS